MTGEVTMYFRAETLPEVVTMATARWREIVGKSTADLPWSTNIALQDHDDEDDDSRLRAVVVVEFDRKLVDGVTAG